VFEFEDWCREDRPRAIEHRAIGGLQKSWLEDLMTRRDWPTTDNPCTT